MREWRYRTTVLDLGTKCIAPGTRCLGVGTRTGLDTVKKTEILSLLRIETPAVQPVACRYTDWGTRLRCLLFSFVKSVSSLDSESIPGIAKDSPLLHSIQTVSGAQPTSYPVDTGALSPGSKVAEVKNGGVIPPYVRMSSWCGDQLIKHRDNFTFLHPYPCYGFLVPVVFCFCWLMFILPRFVFPTPFLFIYIFTVGCTSSYFVLLTV
jgi:hypothetical protein